MFQGQTRKSRFSEHGPGGTEYDVLISFEQSSVPLAAKRTTILPEMQIEKSIVMPTSAGSPSSLEENGPNGKAINISGSKRSTPECVSNSSQHQCSPSYPRGGHLVYVRRKSEAVSGRSTGYDSRSCGTDVPLVIKSIYHDETTQRKAELKEPRNITAEVLPTLRASSAGFSAAKPSVPCSSPKPNNISTPLNFTPYITSANLLLTDQNVNVTHLHELYCRLQKARSQSNQDDYIQMLRSLSSVELSRHAIDLEKRFIQLSVEEAKELHRVRVFDVLGRYIQRMQE